MDDKTIFEMWTQFKELLKSTNRKNIDNVIKWLDESNFKFDPASTQYHNSYRGGLLQHSLQVYYIMKEDFNNLNIFFELQDDTIIITALLHDICKVNCYITEYRNTKNEEGQWVKVPFYKFDDRNPLGHGEKSVMLLQKLGLELSNVEMMLIRNHMGFSETEDIRRVSKAFNYCPQSLVLCYADMLATFCLENKEMPSRFVEKVLGNSITNCLNELNKPKTITVNGMTYELAKPDEEVDDINVILLNYQDKGITKQVKVYSPYKDGLPF